MARHVVFRTIHVNSNFPEFFEHSPRPETDPPRGLLQACLRNPWYHLALSVVQERDFMAKLRLFVVGDDQRTHANGVRRKRPRHRLSGR